MHASIFVSAFLTITLFQAHIRAAEADVAGVKSYLVSSLKKVKQASSEFTVNANAYAALTAAQDGPVKAFAAQKGEVQKLVTKMQENYKAMDSFGYEAVEGIVAGIEKFAAYDVYLDAGLPKAKGSPRKSRH